MTAVATPALDAASLQAAAITGTGSSLSAQSLLEQIFGPIAADPMSVLTGGAATASTGAGDVLGGIFYYVNVGLITLGSLYVAYKSMVAVTQTAHDGDFMGKAYHSVWVPIRITTGIFSLIPVFGGWSLLQVLMLWFGVMGAGLGNMAWQSVAGTFEPYNTLVSSTSPKSSFGTSFVPEVYKMYACVYAHNAQMSAAAGGPVSLTPVANNYGISGAVQDPNLPQQVISFGTLGGKGAECGSIAIPTQISSSTSPATGGATAVLPGSGMFGSSAVSSIGVTIGAVQAKLITDVSTALTGLQGQVSGSAQSFVGSIVAVATPIAGQANTNILTPYNPVAVHTMAIQYQQGLITTMANDMQSLDASNGIKAAMVQSAQTDGFTTAGAWYTTMAAMSYSISQMAEASGASIRTQALPPAPGDSYWKSAFFSISSAEKVAGTLTDSEGQNLAQNSGDSSASSAWKALSGKMGGGIGQNITNWFITDNAGMPVILRMKNIGDNGVGVAEAAITAAGALEGAKTSLLGKVADTLSGGVIGGAISPWIQLVTFVSEMALGAFLTLSIYIPMIPFLVYMGQVVSWLIGVIEGVAAAPFLAFAHLDASGEEGLGQRTHYGYTFMLQSFMRPVMLVFGFVIASKLTDAMGGYLMQIYPMMIANIQMNSITGLLSIFMFIVLFMFFSISLINTCMSVMYILPESIWSFMGAQVSRAQGVGTDTAKWGEGVTKGTVGAKMWQQIMQNGQKNNQGNKTNTNDGELRVRETRASAPSGNGFMQSLPKPKR